MTEAQRTDWSVTVLGEAIARCVSDPLAGRQSLDPRPRLSVPKTTR